MSTHLLRPLFCGPNKTSLILINKLNIILLSENADIDLTTSALIIINVTNEREPFWVPNAWLTWTTECPNKKKTMIHPAHTLSSTTDAFNEECDRLHAIFVRLQYPVAYINSTISSFIHDISSDGKDQQVRVSLPFGGPRELMSPKWKPVSDPTQMPLKARMPCVRDAVY